MMNEIKLFLLDLMWYFVSLFRHFLGKKEYILTEDGKIINTEDNEPLIK